MDRIIEQDVRLSLFRRTLRRYQVLELTLIIGGILLLWGALALGRVQTAFSLARAGWPDRFQIEVVDGDTIRIGEQIYRLVGFNTPEKGRHARCLEERALAEEAARRLRALVAAGGLDLRRVPCACARGTEGTGQCNYGRRCAILTVEGRDVGAILIAEGLAERYVCGERSCPTRRSWCVS